jgi:hypothetical protein
MSPKAPAKRTKLSKKMAALGRLAAGVTSPAKAKASARNGKLGGRPPKFSPGDTAVGGPSAPVPIRGRKVKVVGPASARSSFEVALDGEAFTVPSWRLESL